MNKYLILPTSPIIGFFYRRASCFDFLENGIKDIVLPIVCSSPLNLSRPTVLGNILDNLIYAYEHSNPEVCEEEYRKRVMELVITVPLIESELLAMVQDCCVSQHFSIAPEWERWVGGDIVLMVRDSTFKPFDNGSAKIKYLDSGGPVYVSYN